MQERAETTRRAVLLAAAELFNERGYAGTSISDISERSGRTSGAIYFHYGNKENLALAIVEAHFATWPALVERYAATTGRPALDRLVGLSFEVARAFRDDIVVSAGSRLWAERKAIDAPLPVPFVGWVDVVRRALRRAREQGELAAHIEPASAAHGIVCAFFGLHTVSDALDGRDAIEDRLADLWRLLLPSLQARPETEALLARARSGPGGGDRGCGEEDGAAGEPCPAAASPMLHL
ncbi:ScbR family autoregulator-binding transcription factor [Streptantibioticus cattleyicolor]|uniref:TetR family transcriptional regulator n=1 Tax=Streptantibioticus cattleyicolor (strain ATCC 35852 / DSM 46488 / JCM 4925 / NBRC 14057 / NRRL 8057) TaxID=1003195 RepID=F8JIT5_STREN|nr:ScbR family autoregulator-binding transcription factor [Streptantibioticus cattleyicolor]AEW98983.1 TetR family transcriptional regulator [Streptantibioticus cattleyicolor NRRL 8057 = DSM 46488]CCB71974.1 Regulatory protein [Streptantibioticus cattleyicolor NRRL 8057 = DSM 46488]